MRPFFTNQKQPQAYFCLSTRVSSGEITSPRSCSRVLVIPNLQLSSGHRREIAQRSSYVMGARRDSAHACSPVLCSSGASQEISVASGEGAGVLDYALARHVV